jgi:hypothetical protein
MDPFDLPEPEKPTEAIVPAKAAQLSVTQTQEMALERMTQEIFSDSMRVVSDALAARDVDPAWVKKNEDGSFTLTPPKEWVDTYGPEEAMKRLRTAVHGTMKRQDAPVYLVMALSTVNGVMMARARKEGNIGRPMNVQIVQVAATGETKYPEQEVEK